jgi:hypothetical protein
MPGPASAQTAPYMRTGVRWAATTADDGRTCSNSGHPDGLATPAGEHAAAAVAAGSGEQPAERGWSMGSLHSELSQAGASSCSEEDEDAGNEEGEWSDAGSGQQDGSNSSDSGLAAAGGAADPGDAGLAVQASGHSASASVGELSRGGCNCPGIPGPLGPRPAFTPGSGGASSELELVLFQPTLPQQAAPAATARRGTARACRRRPRRL